MRRPRLITFDVFGTLFRLEEVVNRDLMAEIVRRNGLSMTPEELAQRWWDKSYEVATTGQFFTVETATKEALSRLFEEVGAEDDAEAYTVKLLADWGGTRPYPEVEESLKRLGGFALGIVSNIDDDLLGTLLHRSGLEGRFEVTVTSESTRAYKPDRRIFEQALAEARCSAAEALHLGDTPVDDVLGPKRIGMMAGWVNRRGEALRGKIPPPDFTAKDLAEAAEVILRAGKGS